MPRVRGDHRRFVGRSRLIRNPDLRDDLLASTRVITDGAWHHLAVTYDGSVARFYVDRNQEATYTFAGKMALSVGSPIKIGGRGEGSYTSPFIGDVDEVAIYDHALTSTSIASRWAAR